MQVAVLLLASFAVQVIIVTPIGYSALSGFPSLRTPLMVTGLQPPLVNGAPGLMVAPSWPESANLMILPGQVIVGGVLGVTLTVKVSVAVAFWLSVTVNLNVELVAVQLAATLAVTLPDASTQ